jgi:hypothetical protein
MLMVREERKSVQKENSQFTQGKKEIKQIFKGKGSRASHTLIEK